MSSAIPGPTQSHAQSEGFSGFAMSTFAPSRKDNGALKSNYYVSYQLYPGAQIIQQDDFMVQAKCVPTGPRSLTFTVDFLADPDADPDRIRQWIQLWTMSYDEDRRVIERQQAKHQTMFFNRLTPIGIGPALPPPRWKRPCRRSSLASMTLIEMEPTAVHVGEDELPWVDNDEGTKLKVLVAKVSEGLWIIRTKFAPGVRVQPHKHTGQVYAYTLSGSWKYEESDYVNTAGSFLYEPAGSRHTLVVPETNTEVTDVWFQIYGANLSLDSDGNIERVTDAGSVLQAYVAGCEAMGVTPTTILTD